MASMMMAASIEVLLSDVMSDILSLRRQRDSWHPSHHIVTVFAEARSPSSRLLGKEIDIFSNLIIERHQRLHLET